MNSHTLKSRRDTLLLSAWGGAGLLVIPGGLAQQQNTIDNKRPPLKPAMVHEFVRVGHFDLDRVKAMLAEEPALLNAAWDWGGGDWEAAIGGAGHMGRRDIAQYLLEQGARMDVFVAAMLGRLDIVEPTLKAFPSLLNSKGPHGIPLMAHAREGGAEAAKVVALLESLGVKS